MLRNVNELMGSLFHKLYDIEAKPEPLTKDELNEIESYRDEDGYINLTGVKSNDELTRIVELVDRKNHIEELESEKESSIETLANELATEFLPFLGLDAARLNIKTPAGEASVTIEKDKEPVIKYETKVETPEPDKISYCVNDLDYACNKLNDTSNVNPYREMFAETPTVCLADERAVQLVMAGGVYNPEYYNAVLHICETEHFPNCGVYAQDDATPKVLDAIVVLPNAFGKMYDDEVETFVDMMIEDNTSVYIVDVNTFQLNKIMNPSDLWDYGMTEAQAYSLK